MINALKFFIAGLCPQRPEFERYTFLAACDEINSKCIGLNSTIELGYRKKIASLNFEHFQVLWRWDSRRI